MKELLIKSKRHGKHIVLIDDEDYERISKFKWFINRLGRGLYAARNSGWDRVILMHRSILGLKPGDGKIVDHINRDSLDNRKINLRIASRRENLMNSDHWPRSI